VHRQGERGVDRLERLGMCGGARWVVSFVARDVEPADTLILPMTLIQQVWGWFD
jgi:hypothetical protein